MDLGDGTEEDDGEDGNGQSEGERVGDVPAQPAEPGGQHHHQQHGCPHEGRQEEQQQDQRPRQHGQLQPAEEHQQHLPVAVVKLGFSQRRNFEKFSSFG